MRSYKMQADERVDRNRMESLRVALNAAKTSLRPDDCGLWTIRGSRGYISTLGDGKGFHLIYCSGNGDAPGSKQAWTYIKRRLHFCAVLQNGNEEGCFYLPNLPTSDQAADIRQVIGIRQTVHLTDEAIEIRRSQLRSLRPELLG